MKKQSTEYFALLGKVRDQIFASIIEIVDKLGGRVCLRHYHENEDMERYTFFEVDADGYGRELFLDTLFTNKNGEIEMTMHDTEDCYNPYWELASLNACEANFLLCELESVLEIVEKKGGKVVKDYDPDYEEE